ncbi:MAG: NAD(+) diphosphatase [Lachnospiraceae bacterium]|nr:NAD(+) diphosphatase [Lachnospiraceae bacterium]
MLQEIDPYKFHNEYQNKIPKEEDIIFSFFNKEVVIQKNDEEVTFPQYKDLASSIVNESIQYLFCIDNIDFYINLSEEQIECKGWEYETVQILREFKRKDLRFAAVTAFHLYQWYRDNKYCGRCGEKVQYGTKERVLCCPACGNLIYPKIAPAVIVGVINGNKILLSKYAGREYKKYALLAGFTEVGESLEDTVHREVMEEVGLHVKNISYYKSQPWGFDSNLLVGYFAHLDGDETIQMDRSELAVAEWIDREDLAEEDDGVSITREMMSYFKNHKELSI